MKLGVLSQWFDPETGPAALPGVFSREFMAAGHEVSVLTGFPNYPNGEIYPGFRQRLRHRSNVDGIDLTRVPLYASHNSSAIRRIANYTSFAASATLLSRGALAGVDAMWVYNSPVTIGLPLRWHSHGGGVPYFLHVQDVWPDSLIESGMFPGGAVGKIADNVIRRMVRAAERRATVVGVISQGVRELILERNPRLDPAKIVYVPNPTDETLFVPAPELRRQGFSELDQDHFTLMYMGAIGDVQGLETLLDAAQILMGSAPHVRFELVGDGIARDRLEREAAIRQLDNVVFRGRVAKDDVPAVMASSDAQLVSLADSPFLRLTTPSKISSILASEIPVIGAIAGDGAATLLASGAAFVVDPGDGEALADAVERMARLSTSDRERMGRRGREFYEENFSAAAAAEKIVSSLRGSMHGDK
ncbi:glycosyltransferase involved in cell wall biosynthesis [Homoserinimonas aerilata]|uniref:D-inositol 3-phosphate glycosyltransferase n=1 Tax=Homoserinimonas aerilata TaxID=1162970 RepID=A0A542YKM6_9MICO|nr:glycosyltransferase family 4 protein [Homoserinimonas aerilata]TQL48630.1 glycosyltransferase involved in cell wall biosynthesis [Homoserinimonas aerilata]